MRKMSITIVLVLLGFTLSLTLSLAAAQSNLPKTVDPKVNPVLSWQLFLPLVGKGVPVVPGDPLNGSGAVNRTQLTYNDLMTGSSTAPVDDSAFAFPAAAAMPAHFFEGRLELIGEATNGGFQVIKDLYGYALDGQRHHLPEFSFEFVQNGSHLIPVQQGLSITGSPYWNYIIGPGRIWKETGDNGWSRASFPFALVERNQNCTHNGVMTFLFNGASVSNVRYQITQETCYPFKFDMWGQLAATFIPGTVVNDYAIQANHALEVGNRLPTKPIAALATDFPNSGVNVSVFGSGVTPADMTTYGLFINGTNYVAGCNTRYGQYAYCGNMRVPSYSTAKTSFGAVALLRLGQKYGVGVYNLLIKDYVPEYTSSAGVWTNVIFENAIDMATGNYMFPGYEVDEDTNSSDFFTAESYSAKIAAAFKYPNNALPGTYWNYHTSDTFIVTRAMNNYLKSRVGNSADIFNLVRDEVYNPLKLSAGAMTTERTDNNATGEPFGGYGLFWTQDDIAKIAMLFNNNNGVISKIQILEPSMLADAMQKNSADRGLNTTGTPFYKYHIAVWAKQFTPADSPQYTCSFWVPFMAGYGGIMVAMMPNGSTYYYFSDNGEFVWYNAVSESAKLISHCP